MEKMKKTESEMKAELPEEVYRIARQGGTEAPYSGKYVTTKEKGTYNCMVCGNPLFASDAKFDTKAPGLMGWPSFEQAIEAAVEFKPDNSMGMARTEVVCANCGSHLGHIFDDPSETKTGKHYCINSACLLLNKEEQSKQ
jgi:peptide-methionine (R)-S-oxide reductase